MNQFPFKSSRALIQSGNALIIVLLLIILFSSAAAFSLRNANLFQKVGGVVLGKSRTEKIARTGLDRAVAEVRRRFAQMVNPAMAAGVTPTPVTNYQYRAMFDSDVNEIARVLSQYAGDLVTITDPACTPGDAQNGTLPPGNFGTSVDDRPICLRADQSGHYQYTVTLLNRAELAACATYGFTDSRCESTNTDFRTRLLSQACLSHYLANRNWNEASGACTGPDSYQFGDVAKPPELGYRLIFESRAQDSAGHATVLESEAVLFVLQNNQTQLAVRSVDVDAFNFMQGGNFNGQIRQWIPEMVKNGQWPLFQAAADAYALGNRYAYSFMSPPSASFHNPSMDPLLDLAPTAASFAGTKIREVVSNIGITSALTSHVTSTTNAGAVFPFSKSEETGSSSTAFGAEMGSFGVPVGPGGEFDKTALLAGIDEYYRGQSAPSLGASGAQMIYVSIPNTTDQFTQVPNLDNSLSTRQNSSVILRGKAGEVFDIRGTVYIDGDLVVAGDVAKFRNNGNLVVKGNVYIMTNIDLDREPSGALAGMADPSSTYDYNAQCGGNACDSLKINAAGNIIVGANITNAHVAGMLSTVVSASAAHTGLDIPAMDGMRAQSFGATPTPMTERDDLYQNQSKDYSSLLQVGLTRADNSTFFDPSQQPAATVAPGLLPEGAGSIYGNDDQHAKQYFFYWFRDHTQPNELPAYGFLRHRDDYLGGMGGTDGLGRNMPVCESSALPQCNPGDGAPQASLAGGFLYQSTQSGSPTYNDWGYQLNSATRPWISPQAMHNLFFDGTPDNAGGTAPPITLNTYDTVSGQVKDNSGMTVGPAHTNFISKTNMVKARLAAGGFITGWGGNKSNKFWDPNLDPNKPNLNDPNSPYTGRNYGATCSGAQDCTGDGLTIRDGVHGNILLMSQGGLHVYSNRYREPVGVDQRKVVTVSVRTK